MPKKWKNIDEEIEQTEQLRKYLRELKGLVYSVPVNASAYECLGSFLELPQVLGEDVAMKCFLPVCPAPIIGCAALKVKNVDQMPRILHTNILHHIAKRHWSDFSAEESYVKSYCNSFYETK